MAAFTARRLLCFQQNTAVSRYANTATRLPPHRLRGKRLNIRATATKDSRFRIKYNLIARGPRRQSELLLLSREIEAHLQGRFPCSPPVLEHTGPRPYRLRLFLPRKAAGIIIAAVKRWLL